MDIQSKIGKVKQFAGETVGNVKTTVIDEVEKLHDLKKKNYNVTVVVDKNGVTRTISEGRTTKQTIKWRSKGH